MSCRTSGWSFVPRKEMNDLRGAARMNEAIVEPLLVEAILKLNETRASTRAARQLAAQVRRIDTDREMLDVLRNGLRVQAGAGRADHRRHHHRLATDPTPQLLRRDRGVRHPHRRQPRAAAGRRLPGQRHPAGRHREQGHGRAARRRRRATGPATGTTLPQLVAQTSVIGCCNGLRFRVGPSGLDDLGYYNEWSDPWPHTVADPDDEMLVGLSAFHPYTLVDLAVNFVIFETREGITIKKLARAHQYRAANKLVQRVSMASSSAASSGTPRAPASR